MNQGMNPLDLLKVNRLSSKYRRMYPRVASDVGYAALCDICASKGWCGLCRRLAPNVAGNVSNWGIYFLLCVLSLFPLHMTEYEPVSAVTMSLG